MSALAWIGVGVVTGIVIAAIPVYVYLHRFSASWGRAWGYR
jgi:hypothetical protein